MGKAKKGKKDVKDDGSEEEPDKDEVAAGSKVEKSGVKEDQVEVNNGKKVAAGGKKSKKKKRDEDDDEDIETMLAELALEYSGVKPVKVDEPEAPAEEPSKKVKTKGKDSINQMSADTIEESVPKKKEKKSKKGADKEDAKEVIEDEDKKSKKKVKKLLEKETVEVEEVEDDRQQKKKASAKKGEEKESKEKVKGPNKKVIAAMQEALKKAKEEEEMFARLEEERIRRLEELDKSREEAARLEVEKKERKKQKEKERKERLKSEGKFLTAKQKADRARAQVMLDALKAQGLDMPNVGEKKAPKPGTRIRTNKAKQQADTTLIEVSPSVEEETSVETKMEQTEEKPEAEEEILGVKDAWDADSSEEEELEDEEEEDEDGDETEEKPEKTEDDSEHSDSEDSSSDDEHMTDAERKRERASARIKQRRIDAEANKTLDNLRAAVICVLGHVDTGKTKILDKLRRTNVQDGEAGGITQQIGATNVPMENIKEQTRIVRNFADYDMKIPGLLIIDTPGHESFSNLRSRGSSLCDMAILVVDIMHGIEPQTLESINLLKAKKTPFVVALNKIDRLYDWQTMTRKDIRDVLKAQAANTQLEFDQRCKEVIVQFAEQGMNASLFHENPDIRSYVSLVPTSAITGEGIPNLLALIVESCQNQLAKRLMYSDELQATVLEVKAISGLGTTIDAILINGRLREGDTMILAGTDGPIVTQIRSLLMPQPMKELRVKNAYIEYKEIKAAQGVKIAAKDLEKAIAGLNMQVAQKPDEVELLREEVAKDLKHALSNIKLQDRGVYVQASTLGSLEALLEFLKTSKIPYANIRIGPVVKKDVMKASTMLEHDSQYATILAFDVKVEKDAQDMADTLGVKIFQADIIYHLFDKFIAYRDQLKQRKRDEFKHIAVFPCKLKILPQFVFNSRDPIVMGVMVEAGIVREGTPICVPSKDFVDIGVIRSIENNKKNVETARKGQEVCIKIEAVPGEAPKMFGRHFTEDDFLVSKISRASIDACKDYFREDLIKADWELMVELKKQFEIL